jgi:hypothetical protein
MAPIALIAPEFHYVSCHDSFHGQAVDRRYLPATSVPASHGAMPSVRPGVPPSARGREDCGPSASGRWVMSHTTCVSAVSAVSRGRGNLGGQGRSHLAQSAPSPPSRAVSPCPVYKSVYRTGDCSAVPAPFPPFRGCHPWVRGTKRLPSGMALTRATRRLRSRPTPGRGALVVITAAGLYGGIGRAVALPRPLLRTRLLPDLTADGSAYLLPPARSSQPVLSAWESVPSGLP